MINKINHTQISNDFLDNHMLKFSGNAVKIFLVISRKTIGWHKDLDRISYSQIMELTGIVSKSTVNKAIKELEEKGLIKVIRDEISKKTNVYEINYVDELVQKMDKDSTKIVPEKDNIGTDNVHTKEIFKETKQKKEKSKLEQEKKETLDIWNSYKDQYPDVIIFHTTNKLKKEHIEALKHYTKEQYMNAIWKYCEVHANDKYWPTMKFTYKKLTKFIENIDTWVQTPIKDYIYVDPKEARKPKTELNILNK